MWEPLIIFGTALLRLSLPPANITTGNHEGFNLLIQRELIQEGRVQPNLRLTFSEEETAVIPWVSAGSLVKTGSLRYGEPCTTDGKGKTTDCYYNGISGETACHQTWGPSFRQVGYKPCNIFTTSYCCEKGGRQLMKTEVQSLDETIPFENAMETSEKQPNDGLLRYGAACNGGQGKTTAVYWTGIGGYSPDAACKKTWGPRFRSGDTVSTSLVTAYYCCVPK